jgi:hypothetical protein
MNSIRRIKGCTLRDHHTNASIREDLWIRVLQDGIKDYRNKWLQLLEHLQGIDYKRKILITLLEEGETLADQGKYGLRSSLELEQGSGLFMRMMFRFLYTRPLLRNLMEFPYRHALCRV